MKKLFILFFFLIYTISYSQIQGEDEVYLGGDAVEAKFQGGGMKKFYEFINKEFDFSKVTKAGRMVTSFTIDKLGEVKNIRVVELVDIESATEIIRVLKKAPKWEPSKRGGKPISVEVKFPLVFHNKVEKSREDTELKNDSIKVDESIEKAPIYKKGMKEFYNYILKNFRTPDNDNFKGGKILISFIVDVDGTLTDFKIIKDIGYGTAQEAIRVLNRSPKWQPATQNGVPVRSSYVLPITISPSK